MNTEKSEEQDQCSSGEDGKDRSPGLDQQSRLQIPKAIAAVNKITSAKICSVHGLLGGNCTPQIAKAHSISKSASLKEIAYQGHVLTGNTNLMKLKNNGNKVKLEKIGISEASIFTGFCTKHDTSVFSPLETQPFTASPEQLFLLAYRPVAKELYVKRGVNEAQQASTEILEDTAIERKLILRATAENLRIANDQSIADLSHIKEELDTSLKLANFLTLEHLVIELESIPFIMASAIFVPYRDFDGAPLQYPKYGSERASYVIINAVAIDEKGFVVFSWLREDATTIRNLLKSRLALNVQAIGDALARFILVMTENVFISQVWYKSLGTNKIQHVETMINENDLSERITIWSEGPSLGAIAYVASNFK